MTISLFTDGIYPLTMGGMQKHSFYLAKYLAQEKVHVDVYFGGNEEDSITTLKSHFTKEELSYIQFCVVDLPKARKFPGHYLWESYQYSKSVYNAFLKSDHTDFIYIQGFAGWYYLQQRHKRSVPNAINFHGLNMFQTQPTLWTSWQAMLFRAVSRQLLQKADVVFSLGGKLTLILEALKLKEIVEIPIGIEKHWLIEQPSTNKTRKFIFIGRYERLKGIEELNEALKHLQKTVTPPFEIHFIGPIPEKKQLKQNQTATIVYHGPIYQEEKIQQLLRESDILLCPSWSEGMPTVILEAMASGCAILASDVGAVSEQIGEENGWLIPPGKVKPLENALKTALNLPEKELQQKQKASLKKVEQFLWPQVIKQLVGFVKDKTVTSE